MIAATSIHVTIGEVVASLALVAIAIVVSFWRRAELERDLVVAVIRSFVQLTAVGYVIQAIFDSDSLWLVVLLLAVMVGFGSITARSRAKAVPGSLRPIAIALATAATVTIGLVLALGVFDPRPRYLVPVGGMVIGNAMTAAAVSLNRLADEVRGSALRIEATLALGATAWEASRDLVTRSLRSGMITLVDSTKTTGIVFFPGTMVGMLLAGARPLDAVRLQLILLWSLLGSVALSSVIATGLGYRGFFTPAHQLRELDAGPSAGARPRTRRFRARALRERRSRPRRARARP
ncbi:MAG: UDP-glucose/iron transport system permease protein [Solirubrobacteraceae bacterium]|nr:UDP-glucose/iron transport system permease protein [Solirubrobacteraceae bacterium]